MIVLERPGGLDLASYRRIVVEHEPVGIAPPLLEAVDAERARMLAHLAGGARPTASTPASATSPARRSIPPSRPPSNAASCCAAPARARRSRPRSCAATIC